MTEGKMEPSICPHFWETQEKVRNNDMDAAAPYRFVTRQVCRHKAHPSNLPRTVQNGPKCGEYVTKCEVTDIWQT